MPTIKDIARIAGVSHSTVSRALNDHPRTSEKTKEKIRKIADELDFQINTNARSLNINKTEVIGVILPAYFGDEHCETFMSTLLGKIIRSSECRGIGVRCEFAKNRTLEKSNTRRLVNSRSVDGLIIIEDHYSVEDFTFLQNENFPHVFLHYKPQFEGSSEANFVISNNRLGAFKVCEHLITLGHKKILNLAIDSQSFESRERLAGYIEALQHYGIDDKHSIAGYIGYSAGYDFVMENSALFNEYTALFAAADITAMGALEALKEKGFRVPEDISVAGYDHLYYARFTSPTLTTVHQPLHEISDSAVDQLLRCIDGEIQAPVQTIIEPQLVIQKSTGKCSK